ncbi:MAG: hypothetical protein RBU30_19305 [Polyangia bacterium]|jgi:hypothetical protein|nr:hypothetical protein [Polyangia bacterium]
MPNLTKANDLAGLLVRLGLLEEEAARSARLEAAESGAPLVQVLRQQGLVSDGRILEALRGFMEISQVDPEDARAVELESLRWLPRDLAEARLVLPLRVIQEAGGPLLRVAMADPLDAPSLRAVEQACGMRVEPLLADAGKLEQSIAASYDRITTRLIPRPEWSGQGGPAARGSRRRWRAPGQEEPQTEPSHRMEDEATPLEQMEALRLVLEQKGLVTREEFVEALKALLRQRDGS